MGFKSVTNVLELFANYKVFDPTNQVTFGSATLSLSHRECLMHF